MSLANVSVLQSRLLLFSPVVSSWSSVQCRYWKNTNANPPPPNNSTWESLRLSVNEWWRESVCVCVCERERERERERNNTKKNSETENMYVCAEAYTLYVWPWRTWGLIDHNLWSVCVCVCTTSHPAPIASSGVLWMWFISKLGAPNEDEAGTTATVREGRRRVNT